MDRNFSKAERLHSKKLIETLFKDGKSFFVHPFKVIFMITSVETSPPVSVLISVSKRNVKNATDRNRVKRLIREAYRLNKNQLSNHVSIKDKQLVIGLIYTGRTILPFAQIESKIILILQRLIEQDEQAVG